MVTQWGRQSASKLTLSLRGLDDRQEGSLYVLVGVALRIRSCQERGAWRL